MPEQVVPEQGEKSAPLQEAKRGKPFSVANMVEITEAELRVRDAKTGKPVVERGIAVGHIDPQAAKHFVYDRGLPANFSLKEKPEPKK